MQRVVVLGRGGAGKSTLARQLGEVTGLPAAELDTLFWQAGLTAADPSEWTECQRELVQGEAWILDGACRQVFWPHWLTKDQPAGASSGDHTHWMATSDPMTVPSTYGSGPPTPSLS